MSKSMKNVIVISLILATVACGKKPAEPAAAPATAVAPPAPAPAAPAAPATGGAGVKAFEAALAAADETEAGKLFAEAGKSGEPAVFERATAHYLTEEGRERRGEVLLAIQPFGKQAFAWAAAELPRASRSNQSLLADVIAETAGKDDLATVRQLLGQATRMSARLTLAQCAIKLGDPSQFPVIFAGIASEEFYERDLALIVLGEMVDQLPADQKARATEVLKAARAKDDADAASTYDELLTKIAAK